MGSKAESAVIPFYLLAITTFLGGSGYLYYLVVVALQKYIAS